jgi:hypothetical protein
MRLLDGLTVRATSKANGPFAAGRALANGLFVAGPRFAGPSLAWALHPR